MSISVLAAGLPNSRSLIDRINLGSGRKRAANDDASEVVRSVIDHLQRMLNTRQGHALAAPDYGMPDFTGLAQAPDARRAVQTAFLDCIRKYEPRLTNVRITQIETETLDLRFQILATLQTGPKGLQVAFQTRVEASGRVQVN